MRNPRSSNAIVHGLFIVLTIISASTTTSALVTNETRNNIMSAPQLLALNSSLATIKDVATNATMMKPCHVVRRMIRMMPSLKVTGRNRGKDHQVEWMCELSSEDMIANNAELMVQIEGLAQSFLEDNGAMSGYKTLYHPFAVIKGNKIVFDKKSLPIFGEISGDKKRRLAPGNNGQKSILFVRVVAADGPPTPSLNDISNKAFGTFGATESFRAGMARCSYNQLLMNPASVAFASNGVIEISIPQKAKGNSDNTIWNAAHNILMAKLNVNDMSTVVDHLVYCIPGGTTMIAAAIAFIPGYISWYNNEYCIDPGTVMHELGHNINLSHSSELMGEYSDATCMMGWGGWPNCYNGAKSFQLGWYAPRTQVIDLLTTSVLNPMTFTLIGTTDYQNPRNSASAMVVLKLEAGDRDYYVAFNRKAGITAGTNEYGDQVLITKQNDGGENSRLLAHLSSNNSMLLTTVLIGSSFYDIQITVNSIILNTDPANAVVTITRTLSKVSLSSSPVYGGAGGGDYSGICPTGSFVKSISGWGDGAIGKLMMFCDNGSLLGPFGWGEGAAVEGQDCSSGFSSTSVTSGTYVGKIEPICDSTRFKAIGTAQGGGSGQSATFTCPGTQKLVGVKGRSGLLLDSVSFLCADYVKAASPMYGGGGGSYYYSQTCPSGKKIINMNGRGGFWVDQLTARCDDGSSLGPIGGTGGSPADTITCTGGYTGGTVTHGSVVGQVSLICSSSSTRVPIGSGLGSGSGQTSNFQCPANQFVVGIRGKADSYVDSISFVCSGLPAVSSRMPTKRSTRKPSLRKPSSKPTMRKPSRKPTMRKPSRKPTIRKLSRKPTSKPTKKPTSSATAYNLTWTLYTDDYPLETSLMIVDKTTSVILHNYKAGSGFTFANQLFRSTKYLDNSHCYWIHVDDTEGDGLCCGYGQGWYNVYWNGNLIKTSKFEGGYSELTAVNC